VISPEWIHAVDWGEKTLTVDLSAVAIRNAPRYDPTVPLSREYEARLFDHYGRPMYWI
jgi:hypothetical protein